MNVLIQCDLEDSQHPLASLIATHRNATKGGTAAHNRDSERVILRNFSGRYFARYLAYQSQLNKFRSMT
jgi:hypothetical protein